MKLSVSDFSLAFLFEKWDLQSPDVFLMGFSLIKIARSVTGGFLCVNTRRIPRSDITLDTCRCNAGIYSGCKHMDSTYLN